MKPTVCRNRVRTMKPLLMHLVIPRTAECWYSRCFTLFRCFAVAEGTVQRKAHNAPHVRELHQAPCTIVVSLQCDRLSSADRFVAFQPFASIHSITVSHDNMERRPGLGSDVTNASPLNAFVVLAVTTGMCNQWQLRAMQDMWKKLNWLLRLCWVLSHWKKLHSPLLHRWTG